MICVISGREPKDPKLLCRNLCVFDEQRVGLESSDALTPESGAWKEGWSGRQGMDVVVGAATVPVCSRACRSNMPAARHA